MKEKIQMLEVDINENGNKTHNIDKEFRRIVNAIRRRKQKKSRTSRTFSETQRVL